MLGRLPISTTLNTWELQKFPVKDHLQQPPQMEGTTTTTMQCKEK